MALKTSTDKDEKQPSAVVQDASEAKEEVDTTVLLELALYTNYRMGGNDYVKGTPYRFKRVDAMRLLGEHDMNRPLWRMYRKPVVKRVVEHQVRDATNAALPSREDEPIHGLPIERLPKRRIDVGSDEEIQDILDRPDDDGFGNVTV